ncbi:MAG: hypothetical protein ACRD0S_13830 [Acidimicrobiales bacterium]
MLVHRGGRGQCFVYEALWDGAGTDGRPHLVGLVDVATLADQEEPAPTTADYEGREGDFEPPTRAQRGAIEGGSRQPGNTVPPAGSALLGAGATRNAHQANGSGSHVAAGGGR